MGSEKVNPLTVIGNFTVRKSGVMDFDGLFREIPAWFSRYKYDAKEKSHSEKKGSTGTYMESVWKATRKVTDYTKFIITVEVLLRDKTEVAVETHEGETKKKNRARLQLVFNAKMEKNYDKKFNTKPGSFSNFIRVVYEKYIIKDRLEKQEDKLYEEANDLISTLKGFLE